MSKADDLLRHCRKNLGEWTCGYCSTNSNQPAAIFREVKKRGFEFEEVSPSRWAKFLHCPTCNEKRSHYRLLKKDPVFPEKERISMTPGTRKRIINLFNNRDAFTGATISSKTEVDHKVPWTRLVQDIDANAMDDAEIRKHFQLLTGAHNLLKERRCRACKNTDIRPPFLGIEYWYEGDERYRDSCVGCGWHDGERWRAEFNGKLKR